MANLRFGGLLTLTQSGSGTEVIKSLKNAYEKNLTCFNVVNVENSPITRAIDEIQKEKIVFYMCDIVTFIKKKY